MMIYRLILFLCFIDLALSLRCTKASPSNCIHNLTCSYVTSECQLPSSSHRGGMFCTTIIKQEKQQILIGTMDCIYDQEASKKCSNHSECLMKYTNDKKQFLHCCCDQHECNLNFSLADPEPDTTTPIPPNPCQYLLCNQRSLILMGSLFGLVILFVLILCFIYRTKLIRKLKQCTNQTEKKLTKEECPFLTKDPWEIDIKQIDIDYLIKQGRFTEIKHGFFNKKEIALKIFNSNEQQSKELFEHEKEIYSLPFLQHKNILEYYGYSKTNQAFYLLFQYSSIGSLKNYLISNLITNEKDLLLILKQISEGLHYLHKDFRNESQSKRPPIAHRDFKSENILVFHLNHIVICDLAFSTPIQQYQYGLNQQQQIGTPRYMSPELLVGTIGCEETSLLKCDVYALGIVFWEVLSRFDFQNIDVNKYLLPFEKQLNELKFNVNNPTVNEMNEIIHLKEPRNRPLINSKWNQNDQLKSFEFILNILNECWQFNPDLRISSGVIFNRIQSSLRSNSNIN